MFPSFLAPESRKDFIAPRDLYGSQPLVGADYSQTLNQRVPGCREPNPLPATDKTVAEAEVYNVHSDSCSAEYEESDSDDNSFIAPSSSYVVFIMSHQTRISQNED